MKTCECKNKQFEKALEMACEFISEDADCPLVLFDTHPWIKPCEDVCNEGIESYECWKQYFLNKCEE